MQEVTHSGDTGQLAWGAIRQGGIKGPLRGMSSLSGQRVDGQVAIPLPDKEYIGRHRYWGKVRSL